MDAPLPPPPPQQRLSSLVAEVVCLAALVLACVKLGRGVEAVLDLGLWDEADYLHRALLLPERGLPDPEWGPLYSVWYFALSRVWPDPVDLYYGNSRLLLLLTTVAGYAFLRRVGARPWLALAGAAVYLLSMAPHVLPRPTLLSVLIILVALSAAMSARTMEGACVRVGLGLLIASFARPEYFLSFLLVSGGLAGLLAREAWRGVRKERARGARALRTGAAYGLGVVALVAVMGNPFGNTSNRRFYAFCQHFADNHVRRTGLAVNPWGECNTVIHQVFGQVDTLGAAARANPGAFLTHLGQNLQRYPRESVKMFAAGYGSHSPLPGKRPWTREQAGHLFLLVVAVGLPLGMLAWNARRLARALRSRRVVGTLAATWVVLLPVLVSVVLIQPRQHYLVLQGLMALAVLAALAAAAEPGGAGERPGSQSGSEARGRANSGSAPVSDKKVGAGPGGLVLAALLAGVVVLSVPDLVRRQGGPAAVAREQLQRVTAIRTLGLETRIAPGDAIRVLDAQGGLSVYMGAPFRRVPTWTKRRSESLAEYLHRERIDLVFLDGRLRQDPLFSSDPALESFYAEPGAFGYATWQLPGSDVVLALPDAWASGRTARSAISRPLPAPVPAAPRCDGALPAMESGRSPDAGSRPGCARLPSPHL